MILIEEGYSVFEKIRACLDEGTPCVLCTVVESYGSVPTERGAKMLVLPDNVITGTIGGGVGEYRVLQKARELLLRGPGTLLVREDLNNQEAAEDQGICGGGMTVFLERLVSVPEVVIFGGGHVGKAALKIASFLGWRSVLWDDREEFAALPDGSLRARKICCPLQEVFSRGLKLHENTFALVVTRGHALDAEVVRLLEDKPARYIGMIGSRNKIRSVRERLLEEGISQRHLDRIYQPLGLPLNAQTPEEIALSITAEMVAVHRDASLDLLRESWGPLPGASEAGDILASEEEVS